MSAAVQFSNVCKGQHKIIELARERSAIDECNAGLC